MCDGAVDYAQHIPVEIIAHMLGIPASDGDRFRGWIKAVLQDGITDYAAARARLRGVIRAYFYPQHLAERRSKPGEDLISYLSAQQTYPDGRQFTDNHVLGSVQLLLVAGIDTTWSGIGSCLWHLAPRCRGPPPPGAGTGADADGHPGVPARLCAGDHGARGGQGRPRSAAAPFKEGQMVLLPFPAANRDPANSSPTPTR